MKSEELINLLEEYAQEYLVECLENTTEKLSNKGTKVKVMDRHIPTIDYFINIHLLIVKKKKIIARSTFYKWINTNVDLPAENETPTKAQKLQKLKVDTIKKIDAQFKALATDIVANEGKGIFYAKNRLNMTDKLKTDGEQVVTHKIISLGSGVNPEAPKK